MMRMRSLENLVIQRVKRYLPIFLVTPPNTAFYIIVDAILHVVIKSQHKGTHGDKKGRVMSFIGAVGAVVIRYLEKPSLLSLRLHFATIEITLSLDFKGFVSCLCFLCDSVSSTNFLFSTVTVRVSSEKNFHLLPL